MNLATLVLRYVASAENAFKELKITEGQQIDIDRVQSVLQSARNYLEDAKFYMETRKLEVSLTSIAYCEGLLDALKTLGLVNFEWLSPREQEK